MQMQLFYKKHSFFDNSVSRGSYICAVIHFAAHADVAESFKSTSEYYANNVRKYMNFLSVHSRMSPHIPIIFLSSYSVYGQSDHFVAIEGLEYEHVSPYGRTKAICETPNKDFSSCYGMKMLNLRYLNVHGAWPEEHLGKMHNPDSHILPLLIDVVHTFGPFILRGSFYNTADGTAVRDFVHIIDLADAQITALGYLARVTIDSNYCDTYNVDSGPGTSVLMVIKTVERQTQSSIGIIWYATRGRHGDYCDRSIQDE